MNNKKKQTFEELGDENGKLILTNREKGAVFLDLRTILEPSLMDTDGWKDAKKQLRKYYVEFFVQCKAYERMKKIQ